MAGSSAKSDDRRRAILDIARDVFMTQGYAAASMSAIAARLGGSKGTLYNYFPSKEALFAEFMRDQCEAEADGVYEFVAADDDLRHALCEVGKRLMRFIFSEKVQAIHRLAIAESGRFPELGRAFYENGPRVGILRLASHLEQWMEKGKLRRADPVRTAERFGDLCKAGLYQRLMWNVERAADAQIDENVEEAVRIFMAAYAI